MYCLTIKIFSKLSVLPSFPLYCLYFYELIFFIVTYGLCGRLSRLHSASLLGLKRKIRTKNSAYTILLSNEISRPFKTVKISVIDSEAWHTDSKYLFEPCLCTQIRLSNSHMLTSSNSPSFQGIQTFDTQLKR